MRDTKTALLSAVALSAGEESAIFNSFTRLIGSAAPEIIDRLLDFVDDSDYSLADWAAALGEFDNWLEICGEPSRPLGEMLGYIHCCTRMQSPGIRSANLKVIVRKALTDFGFNAVSEAQN